jgi:hypothetical protein
VTATLRWLAGIRITGAMPCIVVEEPAEFVALFQPAGSLWRRASGTRSGPRGRNMVDADWDGTHQLVGWLGQGVLRLHQFGQPWSIWRWLDSDRRWSDDFYVNLEDPWRQTSIGFDSGDWILDVVARDDGSWRYKDEDELDWAESTGVVSGTWSDRARAAGRDATEAVEARGWPFDADWDRWLPPPDAEIPVLPRDWARIQQPGTGA